MEKFVRYIEIFSLYDRCLAVQMTNSIQSLCLESMRDFDKVRTYAYSLQQKHCTTALDEKSLLFLTVNFFEILHVSTYTMYKYKYMSIVKKTPRMATLTYSHFANPSRSHHRAHYVVLSFL